MSRSCRRQAGGRPLQLLLLLLLRMLTPGQLSLFESAKVVQLDDLLMLLWRQRCQLALQIRRHPRYPVCRCTGNRRLQMRLLLLQLRQVLNHWMLGSACGRPRAVLQQVLAERRLLRQQRCLRTWTAGCLPCLLLLLPLLLWLASGMLLLLLAPRQQ